MMVLSPHNLTYHVLTLSTEYKNSKRCTISLFTLLVRFAGKEYIIIA